MPRTDVTDATHVAPDPADEADDQSWLDWADGPEHQGWPYADTREEHEGLR
jgi:hypothetical protein